MMTDSQQLLAEYGAHGSEAAFRELVARYIDLVYSTALRLVGGDTYLAQDVAQTVFISLARKGPTLSGKVMLGGWLHQHTYHVATRAVRNERRRQMRERVAVEMNTLQDDSGATTWRQLAPVLDEAITQLGEEDRTAIVLRFFEQRDFRSVGEALGGTPDAARVRVNRALEKLHGLLKQRAVAISVGTLGSALTVGTVSAAPAGLATAIAHTALAGVAAGTGTTLLLKLMTATKLKFGLAALVVAGTATTLLIQHQSNVSVRGENQSLRHQIAQLQAENDGLSNQVASRRGTFVPRLPEPAGPTAVPTNSNLPAELRQSRNLYALLTNKTTKLSAAQVEAYLKANRRNAASLLAAFRTTEDPALLQEAMQTYPNDPQVGFEAAIRKEASPAERRQWLDIFKQSAPDNALANYLSALDWFKAGQTEQALQDLRSGESKPQFQDYSLDRVQADEEAYRAANYPVADAKVVATAHLLLPQLAQVRDLGRNVLNLADSYQQAGDETARQAALEMAVRLGRRYSEAGAGEMLIAQLVGINVERLALGALDPNAAYDANGQTVQERLDHLAQQRAAFKQLSQQANPLWEMMSDQDWISYHNRSATFGEGQAMRWLVAKYGQQ
ncbi:MAG TPA: sigma-70 family RNA polymerase sigma factor [Verrucomicrobiae bacterium]|nr:sigma-70 family RNA polymerase sigma factor [Verrucomicrobiae bacterium]